MSSAPPLHVFDAYGTLFDVNAAVMRNAGAVGEQAPRLAELWRLKQLEYSWVCSLAGKPLDFWTLTVRSLDHAAARCGGVTPEVWQDAYARLDAYPDVEPTLRALRQRGSRTAILSNGSPAMLAAALAAAGLAQLFDAVLSVEPAGVYKTDPRAYALVTDRFRLSPGDVSFVSSNRWDIAGAAAFGFRTLWINRTAAPDEYPEWRPERVFASLLQLVPRRDPQDLSPTP